MTKERRRIVDGMGWAYVTEASEEDEHNDNDFSQAHVSVCNFA